MKSCGITKKFMAMVWKLQCVVCLFFFSKEAKYEVDTTSIILSYIYHSENVNKWLFRYCWSVFILVFCVYVFLRALFNSSAIMKLRTASCLHICIAFYLAFHKIMCYNKRINSHGHYKVLLFFCFARKLNSRLILPP